MTEALARTDLRAELLRRRLRGDVTVAPDNRIRRVPRSGPLTVSFAQRRLWILDQLRGGGTEYLMTTGLRLAGPLDTGALRTALDGLVARHEVLRTRYVVIDDEPAQVVDDPGPVALTEVDLRDLDRAAQDARLAGWTSHDRRPVDLAGGPVLAATLARLGDEEHALLLTLHHIAFDEWSEEVLWRELDRRYAAALAGEAAALPPLPVQYADFAAWQRTAMSGATLDRQLGYWRGKLAGATPLELPADRPRPPVRDSTGGKVPFVVPASVAGRLTRFARQAGATPFMALLAAYTILLGRYAGRTDVTVGTPVAGRDRAEVQDLIGLFLNTLVLRTDLSGDPSFAEVLRRVKETALDAYAHQELPFERLVEELSPERDPARTPLFATMFLWDGAGTARPRRFGGLRAEPLPVGESDAKFDLTVAVADRPDGSLAGAVNYATALFDRETAERFAAQFVELVSGLADAPRTPVSRLSVLPPAERRRVLEEWNDTAVDYPTDDTLPALFERQAARTPDAVAVVSGDDTVSYAELNTRANRLAHRLIAAGVGPETVVGVRRERGPELVVALLAVLKAGGAYLPLDPDNPADRLAYMCADAGVTIVLDDTGRFTADGGPADNPGTAPHPDHPAYVIYTSGSTGRPKGVVVGHRAIVNRLHWMQDTYRLDPTDRVLQKTPYGFDVSVWEFFWPLITGAALVLARPGGHRDPGYLAELITTERVTTVHFVPTMLRAFLAEPHPPLPSLRRMICSGEALTADLVDAVHERIGCELHNLYGPTEAAVDVTAARCVPGTPVTIGRPIANTRAYIVDDTLRPVPIGVPGELLLGGVQLARGYLHRPELTADRFVPDPFGRRSGERLYRTGDLARYRPDGSIEYLGRLDRQVKIRGHRIELGEVEAVLGELPGLAAAAVAVHDGQLVGYLAAGAGAEVDATAAAAFLRDRLPEAMVPSHWVPLAALPLTPSGKLDRAALPKPDRTRSALAGAYVAPRGELERQVADALTAALGVDRIGAHDRFFDLGGDSIRAIRAIGRLRATGVNLSVQDIFLHQTPAELAAAAGRADATAEETHVGRFTQLTPADRDRLPDGLVDAYPMGQVQAGMVYEMLADTEHPAYQNVTSFPITDDGPFSLAALRAAGQLLVDRHEILRTTFDMSGYSEPMQLVHASAHAEIGYDDLRGLPEAEQQAVLAAYRHTMRTSPLDVAHAPQLRWHVHRTGEREWVLTHTECHAILDGWSHHSLIGQLRATYRAIRDGGTDGPGSAPEARYADFVALERRSLAAAADQEFWRDRVRGFDRLALPADTAPAGYGKVEELRVSWRHLEPALRDLVARTRTSLKTVLHTAHLAMLGVITGQRRFFSGLVCNGRPELLRGDEVLGMHLNTLPFAVDLRAPSWRDLLRAVFDEELALWPHRRYPLPAIQREWGDGRPLIDVIFSYLDFHVLDDQQEAFGTIVDDSPNEFTLNVLTFPGEVRLECRAGWATRERLEALGATYLELLTAMVADGGANPVELGATSAERLSVPAPTWRTPPEVCVTDLFAARVAARPDAVAVEFGEQRLTYRELDARANQLAWALREHGVGPDTPVAVCLDRGLDVITALLGVLKAGGCYLPLDPAYPDSRIGYILDDAGARVMLTQPDQAHRFGADTGLTTIVLDPAWRALADRPTDTPEVRLSPDNLAYVTYTSGSTGRPKGVLVPHRGVVRLVHDPNYTTLGEEQTLFLLSALAFDVSTFEIWGSLCTGARLVVCPPGTPTAAELEELLRRHGVTVLWLTSGLFNTIVDVRPEALATVRHLLVGGEALSPPHVRTALEHGVPVGNGYGPTEGTVFATAHPRVSRAETESSIPIGTPVSHTRVQVVDRDLNPVPYGVPGELLLGGPGVVRGYQGRPDLTAERFVPDPSGTEPGARLYRTGDIVRQNPDGTLHYIGRQDHQVKIRGHRVELGEVEAALAELPSVRTAAAAAYRGSDGVKQLVGYVVLDADGPADPARLGDLMRRRVPDFLVPTAWVRLDQLPLNASGKVDRAALPLPAAADRTREFSAPRTPAERAVADIWAEVFGLPRVSRHDDFFDLGGHSLLILRIIAMLRQRHGIEVPVRSFLTHRTVEALAESIDSGELPTKALLWLNRAGERAPLVCIHPGGGSAHWYQRLVVHLDPDLPVIAFEWPGVQGGQVPATAEMAARYVAELREAVPHGPYRIFSWCGGSGVASEVVHRLAADGEDVTFILLDPALDASEKQHLWDEFGLIKKCVANLEALAGAAPEEDTSTLRRETIGLLEHLVDDFVGDDGITLPERGAGDMWLPAARMWAEVMEMMMSYRHRRYAGRLHLIVSDELAQGEHEVVDAGQSFAEYLARWRELAAEVRVHRMTGDHFSVMREDVSQLARIITDQLG
ncbi:non-ribosomal peptide synthetase [Micromonospora eburnea]|uniref:Amino acid adenylation domain-containing protein n=1 Tax=Micromonospora eburnea TaxID=227316 RepID=A0A1C6UVR5_9ACTN|nr:non-ribosomal peptide synthetase [Micromonospora eburnea]SCL57953.1 amino acid adenylation domain-containing protein [Micromonospora eburnea]